MCSRIILCAARNQLSTQRADPKPFPAMKSDWNHQDSVPRWNGDSAGFKRWQQEVRIYRLPCDLSKMRSYSAELVMGVSGAARTAALQLSNDVLCPFASDAGQIQPSSWKSMNQKGMQNMMEKFESELLQSKPIQRGERLSSSIATAKYWRTRGTPMAE